MNDPLIGMKHPDVCKREIIEKRKLADEAEKLGKSEEAQRLRFEADSLEKELPFLEEKNLKRKKIRQAMSLAYNRLERIKIFANGRAEPAQGPIPPEFNGYDPNFRNPYSEFNLEKARQLLAEAGYPDGVGSDGKRLELNFETTGASTTTQQNADFFRQEMKKLGITININQNTWTEFQEKLRTNRAQIYGLGWIADYPDPENFLQLFYGPNKSPNPNNANYENPEYDRLYEEMAVLSDFDPEESRRKHEICRQMEKIVTEDCPWIFGLTYWSYTLVQSWHKNFKPHAFAYNTYKYHSVDPALRRKLSIEWNKPTMFLAYVILAIVLTIAGLFFYKLKKQSE
jgi:ABC-type transport system substrate-binding protein